MPVVEEITDEDIRKLCRLWALTIKRDALTDMGDTEKINFVLKETAQALMELVDAAHG